MGVTSFWLLVVENTLGNLKLSQLLCVKNGDR